MLSNMVLERVLGFMLFVSGCLAQRRNITLGVDRYEATFRKEQVDEYDQCYVDVVVYNSSSFTYGLENATVIALSGKLDDPEKLNYSEAVTDRIGHSCVPVNCRTEVRVFVEKNNARVRALNMTMQRRNIPSFFRVNITFGNEVIQFFSYAWGTIGGRTGPVYSTNEKAKCVAANTMNYHFVFSYLTVFDRLVSTIRPPVDATDVNDPYINTAWNYGYDTRYCYFKVKIKTPSTQVKIEAFSRLQNGTVLGLFQTGPQYDVNGVDTVNKAACVEFRCPVIDASWGDEINTDVDGTIEVPERPTGCCVSNKQSGIFEVKPNSFKTKTSFGKNDNYGAEKGIYISDNPFRARAKCFTGLEIIGSEYAMNVSLGYAFEYDCTLTPTCQADSFLIGK